MMICHASMLFVKQHVHEYATNDTTCIYRVECLTSINTVNCRHTHTQYPEIIENVKYKIHTYFGFSYNVKEKYLGTYIYEYTNLILSAVKYDSNFTSGINFHRKHVFISS